MKTTKSNTRWLGSRRSAISEASLVDATPHQHTTHSNITRFASSSITRNALLSRPPGREACCSALGARRLHHRYGARRAKLPKQLGRKSRAPKRSHLASRVTMQLCVRYSASSEPALPSALRRGRSRVAASCGHSAAHCFDVGGGCSRACYGGAHQVCRHRLRGRAQVGRPRVHLGRSLRPAGRALVRRFTRCQAVGADAQARCVRLAGSTSARSRASCRTRASWTRTAASASPAGATLCRSARRTPALAHVRAPAATTTRTTRRGCGSRTSASSCRCATPLLTARGDAALTRERTQMAVRRGGVKILGGCFGCQARRRFASCVCCCAC